MTKEEIELLVKTRQRLLTEFTKLRDYKNNENAIMKEVDYAKSLHFTITDLDSVLKAYVNFSGKK